MPPSPDDSADVAPLSVRHSAAELPRVLGLFDAVLLVIGGIIGSVPTAAPPPPPPVEQKKTVQRIRVGGQVQQANLIRQPKPIYPPLAKQARIQGVVRFEALIGRDGTIQNLRLVSGHPLLVPSAQEAVKQWLYRPTLLNGEPVEVATVIDVNFTLSQ